MPGVKSLLLQYDSLITPTVRYRQLWCQLNNGDKKENNAACVHKHGAQGANEAMKHCTDHYDTSVRKVHIALLIPRVLGSLRDNCHLQTGYDGAASPVLNRVMGGKTSCSS